MSAEIKPSVSSKNFNKTKGPKRTGIVAQWLYVISAVKISHTLTIRTHTRERAGSCRARRAQEERGNHIIMRVPMLKERGASPTSLCISSEHKMADDDDWMNDDIAIAVPTAPEVGQSATSACGLRSRCSLFCFLDSSPGVISANVCFWTLCGLVSSCCCSEISNHSR